MRPAVVVKERCRARIGAARPRGRPASADSRPDAVGMLPAALETPRDATETYACRAPARGTSGRRSARLRCSAAPLPRNAAATKAHDSFAVRARRGVAGASPEIVISPLTAQRWT